MSAKIIACGGMGLALRPDSYSGDEGSIPSPATTGVDDGDVR